MSVYHYRCLAESTGGHSVALPNEGSIKVCRMMVYERAGPPRFGNGDRMDTNVSCLHDEVSSVS